MGRTGRGGFPLKCLLATGEGRCVLVELAVVVALLETDRETRGADRSDAAESPQGSASGAGLRDNPKGTTRRSLPWQQFGIAAVLTIVLLFSIAAEAQTITPPDVVKLPSGINLGGSSFFDGSAGSIQAGCSRTTPDETT
jgi:hypothetical protein